jgi:hypothetical protein
MHIFFFLLSFTLLLLLSGLFLYKEFVLIKEMYGVQRACNKLFRSIWIWFMFNLVYAAFFSYSATYKYQIEYIPINLFIVFQFSKSIYKRYKGGAVILDCGQSSSHKLTRNIQIYIALLAIIQLVSLHNRLIHPLFSQLLISVYAILSNSLNLEFREKGIALAYEFVKWKDIKHYCLAPLVYKNPGRIIFQTKRNFSLASEYRSAEIPEKYWRSVCETLEQYLPNKKL